MPTPVKEYREFYLRDTQVSSGAKADQETGYPVSYSATIAGVIKTVFNRFKKNHYPSEGVFKKFLESITFKLNQEDTAKLAEQGLVKVATDSNAESRTSALTTDFTAAVVPHQLPEIIVTNNGGTDSVAVVVGTDNGIKVTSYRRTISGLFKKIFKIEVVVQDSVVIDGTTKAIKLSGDTATPGDGYAYMQTSSAKGWFNLFGYITTQLALRVPSGVIVMWSGSLGAIPTGWLLCDGSGGTPNLRDRFIVGAGITYAVGATGGAATVQLTASESGIPSHTHGPGTLGFSTLGKNISGPHTHDYSVQLGSSTAAAGADVAVVTPTPSLAATSSESAVPAVDIVLEVGTTASNSANSAASAHENRPPYYALAYIMKS